MSLLNDGTEMTRSGFVSVVSVFFFSCVQEKRKRRKMKEMWRGVMLILGTKIMVWNGELKVSLKFEVQSPVRGYILIVTT